MKDWDSGELKRKTLRGSAERKECKLRKRGRTYGCFSEKGEGVYYHL